MNKVLKGILIGLGVTAATVVTLVGGYVGYLLLSYKRIGDQTLEIYKKAEKENVTINETYNISTYNIGFGAYSQDFTFFLDTGYDENGNETCGYYSTAKSKDEVIFNTEGSISTLKDYSLDFMLLQEVDIDSTRSHHVNQNNMFKNNFNNYDNVFACNFDSAFLPYPLYDMHGKSKAGLSTFSKYKIKVAERMEYSIKEDLSKFFDLDRCFSISSIDVNNGKSLYIINSHMSAYDEGGVIKKKQVKELNEILSSLYENGDYVIVGGDFNHDLLTYNPDYNYSSTNRPFNNILKDPDWVVSYFDEEGNSPLTEGYKVIASDNVPTCRNNDVKWNPDYTYKCVVDGFIVSSNIEVIDNYNIETKQGNLNIDGFAFSDHQPAYMSFKLI